MSLEALLDPTPIILLVALIAAPVTALVGTRRPAMAPRVAIVMALLAFAAVLWGWAEGGAPIDLPWAPTWGLHLRLTLDGLATLYALLATGIGLVVLFYSAWYMPRHLHHEERPPDEAVRFYAFILLFMGAMVGLVMAQDLLLLFVFWDLTAIASYFLIGYERHRPTARAAALMALLVTGISAVCLLIGAIVLQTGYGSFDLAELIGRVEPGPRLTIAGGLMMAAGLVKSAQVPFHFWLPRAMAAPTPVSAYLHSAAMVAAGVFLLARLYPLLQLDARLLDALVVIGFGSMGVGGALALSKSELKPLLAYSTIAQYGYVVVMLGLGGAYGLAGGAFYVIAHALAKCALFLTAGAVTEATGEKDLSRLGGLWRSQPLLALGSGAAAASLAALPVTIGFFKDELFFVAALDRGPVVTALAVLGAAMTFAYVARFWSGIFLGSARGKAPAHPIPAALVVPIALLGLLGILGGIIVDPAVRLAEAAGAVSLRAPAEISPAYHLDTRPENLLALATYGLAGLLLVTRPLWRNLVSAFSRVGARVGPEHAYHLTLTGLNRFSDSIHRIEVRDLRSRIATILVPGGVLVIAGVLATPIAGAFTPGSISRLELPLALMLVVASAAAVATAFPRDHLALALVLSGVGFSLAVVYAFLGAPNVALVAVLMETLFALLFLGILTVMPRALLRQATDRPAAETHRWRDPLVAILSGGVALVVVWGALSKPAALESVALEQTNLTPTAHAKDVVTAILADFRGLDTMGEITVIGIALLGLITLLGSRTVR